MTSNRQKLTLKAGKKLEHNFQHLPPACPANGFTSFQKNLVRTCHARKVSSSIHKHAAVNKKRGLMLTFFENS
jgi:hypothetical protein